MNTLTWPQAFNKITEAYINGEIEPLSPRFCFCGTLCNNSIDWHKNSSDAYWDKKPHYDYQDYSGMDYTRMETALFKHVLHVGKYEKDYEDALFAGMTAALEVLKEIHRERGEDVDAHSLVFEKRGVVL